MLFEMLELHSGGPRYIDVYGGLQPTDTSYTVYLLSKGYGGRTGNINFIFYIPGGM